MKLKTVFLVFCLTLVLSACDNSAIQTRKREYLGNPQAFVEIQIYSDLQCPACSRASIFTDALLEKYEDQIKISFHHFPLETIHPNAFGAAVAAECAGQQESFWQYIKYAYNFQNELDTKGLKKHALNLGLNTEKFNTCIDNQSTASLVKADLQESLQMNLRGTPSFVINGDILEIKTYEDIYTKIDAELTERENTAIQ